MLGVRRAGGGEKEWGRREGGLGRDKAGDVRKEAELGVKGQTYVPPAVSGKMASAL